MRWTSAVVVWRPLSYMQFYSVLWASEPGQPKGTVYGHCGYHGVICCSTMWYLVCFALLRVPFLKLFSPHMLPSEICNSYSLVHTVLKSIVMGTISFLLLFSSFEKRLTPSFFLNFKFTLFTFQVFRRCRYFSVIFLWPQPQQPLPQPSAYNH